MIGEFFEKILKEEEETVTNLVTITPEEAKKIKVNLKALWPALLVFLIALAPRLYFLFSHDPQNIGYDWYGDVYHHWQIAYLSKTVGFSHGFLRLWDLKGMEYFWGLLQPLTLAILFTVTHSVNIIIVRLLSLICGAVVCALVFLIVKRDFNTPAAWASALFIAFMPVGLFSDTLGMQEPLGLVLLLTGVLAWPSFPVVTGLSWGLAAMDRAEYWLFSAGLLIAALLDRRKIKGASRLWLLGSWAVVIIFYMKYLATWTGNYIYPIYWNFLASVIGKWFTKGANPYLPHEYMSATKAVMLVVFIAAALISLVFLFKQFKGYLFYLVGFFNIALVGFMFSLAAYVWGYIDRFWVDRLFAWPYGFIGILLSIFLLYVVPRKLAIWRKLGVGWLIMLTILLATQLLWKPIFYYWTMAQKPWNWAKQMASATVGYWDKQGKILLPENQPHIVYCLVYYQGVKGDQIVGQMFDPFYYATEDPYKNWSVNRNKILSWFKDENITFIVYSGKDKYDNLMKFEPEHFKFVVTEPDGLYNFVKVVGLENENLQ